MGWLGAKTDKRPAQGLIDVRELIGRLSNEDLLAAADAYFAGLTIDSEQCHKPFSNVADAVHIHRNLGLLLQAADLFRGAEVLDFGCATGWLTISVANLGCQVIGIDISPGAIELARQVLAARGLRPGGSVKFCVYEGQRLPVDDASLDRVLCFDAFHHVRDQAATLAELSRVLRPGGRIAMLEPGPNHSRTPQSQREMSMYNVIENDVDMARIADAAQAAGLGPPEMLVQLPAPLVVPFHQYQKWALAGNLSPADAQFLVGGLAQGLTNTQCFVLAKPGKAVVDSRQAEALAAELRLVSAQPAGDGSGEFTLRLAVRNTGEATWLIKPGAAAHVTLGVQLLAADGSLRNRDFMRLPLNASAAAPGGEQVVTVRVKTRDIEGHRLRFDLVAEFVIWFSQNGRTTAVDWPVGQVS